MAQQDTLFNMKKLSLEMLDLESYLDEVYLNSFDEVKKYETEKKIHRKDSFTAYAFLIVAFISFIVDPEAFPLILAIPLRLLRILRWLILAGAAFLFYGFVITGGQVLKIYKKEADAVREEYEKREKAYARHAELEAQLKKLKKSLPDHQKYRFFFEVPYEPFRTNFSRTGNWLQAGAPKFMVKDDELFVDGFDEPVLCKYHEIAECISPETVGIYADFDYLEKHKDEKFIVERINYHGALPVRKNEISYRPGKVNVTKALMNYESRLDGMERAFYQSAGYGFHTGDDLYHAGRMTDLAYMESCNIRSKRMSAMKNTLETHNANLKQTREVVTGIRHVVFVVGYAIYNKNYELVLLLLNRYSPVTNIVTELDQKIDLTQYNFNSTRLMQGKVSDVYLSENEVGGGTNFDAMTYVTDKYRSKLTKFDPLEQPPQGMNDKEFRNWIKAKRHYCK